MPYWLYFLILRNSYQYDLKPELVMAVIWSESSFRPGAVGNSGLSFGLMQLHLHGAGHGHQPSELLDPATNLKIGCEYLRACLDAAKGVEADAVSAYNQGIAGWKSRGQMVNQGYVNRVMDRMRKLKSAEISPYGAPFDKCVVYIQED